jgi:hypothetical protein
MAQVSFPDYEGLVTLHKVKLNSRGYTKEGVYFGCGMSLYFLDAVVDNFNGTHFRAFGRNDAIFRAKAFFPKGRFIKTRNMNSQSV